MLALLESLNEERSSLSAILPEVPRHFVHHCDFQGNGYPGGRTGTRLTPAVRRRYKLKPVPRPKYVKVKDRWPGRQPKLPKISPPPVNPSPQPVAPKPVPRQVLNPAPTLPPYAPRLSPKGMRLLRTMIRLNPHLRLALRVGEIWLPGKETPGGYQLPQGWEIICDVGGDKVFWNAASSPPGLICDPTALDVPRGAIGTDIQTFGPGWPFTWVAFGVDNSIGPVGRMGRNEQWYTPNWPDRVEKIPYIPPVIAPPVPVAAPLPQTQPLPWRLIPYIRDPLTRDAGNGPKRNPPPVTRLPGPPPPRTRERKTNNKWLPAMRALLGAFHGLGEIGDTVGALSDAIRGNPCKDASGLEQKMICVLNNLHNIDGPQAVANLLQNHIEDRTVGGLLGKLKRAGIGLGPNGQPYLARGRNGTPNVMIEGG